MYKDAVINPLGYWTGGINVDTGAVNRKLGSDMGRSVTGGGLHGKDLSKADVSVNIYAFQKAQETGEVVELCCAIGDDTIDGKPKCEKKSKRTSRSRKKRNNLSKKNLTLRLQSDFWQIKKPDRNSRTPVPTYR